MGDFYLLTPTHLGLIAHRSLTYGRFFKYAQDKTGQVVLVPMLNRALFGRRNPINFVNLQSKVFDMANLNYRKSLGMSLCAFYGIITLASIAQIISNNYGLYNPTFSPLIWVVQDIICCASMCFITFNKAIQPNKIGKLGSGILALFFGLFTINIFLSYAGINMFSFLCHYFNVAVGIIELIAAGLLFYSLRTWLPVKISAFLYWIPTLCSTFYISKLRMASELADKTSDWTLFQEIFEASQTCDNIALAISILTVVITTVWIVKKPMANHAKSNPIDII